MNIGKIINLTPHVINYDDGETKLTIPSSGEARCAVTREPVVSYDIKLTRSVYGAVTGLPAPESGTKYIVSLLVRQACPHRTDICSPGELIRNAAGQVTGCKSFDVN